MKNDKAIKYKKLTYNELVLISAEVNAKGVGSFLEDFYMAWVNSFKLGELSIIIDPVIFGDEESMQTPTKIESSILFDLRILAVKNGMSLKHYMESICEWLANEHRANGRFWFDDTPKRALPIRTRKL